MVPGIPGDPAAGGDADAAVDAAVFECDVPCPDVEIRAAAAGCGGCPAARCARGARHSRLSASRQAVAGGPGRASYAWNEPLAPKQKLSPEDRYSPFVSGGTVLFRPAPEVKKLADLGPVTMLFPDWAQYVAPALALFQSSPEIFKRDTEFRGSFAVAGTARAR